MDERKKEEATQDRQNEASRANSPEQGRVVGSNQPAAGQEADISQIDQQEGQMNNGELGGNFNKPETAGA